MASPNAHEFAARFSQKAGLKADADKAGRLNGAGPNEGGLRKLWEMSELSASEFADEIALFFELPRVTLQEMMAAESRVQQFSRRFLREMAVFPCQPGGGAPTLVMADPTDRASIQAAGIVLGIAPLVKVASFEDIATALDQRLGDEESASAGSTVSATVQDDDIDNLRDLASGAPVVRAVNDMFETAVELRASDIHIEPGRTSLVIRMRVDGLLRIAATPTSVPPAAVISRIKILAGLNIAERRLPQDGGARVRAARSELDVRVAIMPTQHGESAVIRLLPRDRALLSVDKLGFLAGDQSKLRRMLALPHGMIIVTGPTGSGKTTTLATVLSLLNEPTRKILTIEDPVEYEIPGVSQSQAKPSIGLTFATALRSFVRQDPDVIMVGEVRDSETAHVAVHAALTGHLVLTTLHTETAAAAVPRLLDLGVEAFLLRSTLRAVIAQRLVRQLCDRCKGSRPLTHADVEADPRYTAVGLRVGNVIFEPVGCERCGNVGYRGRIGVFEVLEMNEDVRALVEEQSDWESIDKVAIRNGMTTMIEDGLAKCLSGMTSAAEILRVTTVR
ncbi:type II/IV secretion system protein [Bradyrhizobium diazoefficiens]|nr:GspE/PulE family protein [Bradyrhizobium diazoefficiens]MBR0964108.1 type II/IV secretion system protein [Bradyrhizobium diazoefficiens]MBR0978268.1 type II/IV secretion system protein [Bradyrhizobium diazoefficiens]MBR1006199.1 type II/IV secretion system protein [Bradyrhizobium diazoefficiens]MBR1014251.1 type II/IV secretion system protein [Bradyrhizobium diazoefficiens]MBR1050388.1 type II/IV secretion system protein [Bradyrhizobium diazoefficiens]